MTNLAACPSCGSQLDVTFFKVNAAGSLSVTERMPKPRDCSLCVHCGEIYEFGEDLVAIKATDETLARLDLIEVQLLRKIWAGFKLFQSQKKKQRK